MKTYAHTNTYARNCQVLNQIKKTTGATFWVFSSTSKACLLCRVDHEDEYIITWSKDTLSAYAWIEENGN